MGQGVAAGGGLNKLGRGASTAAEASGGSPALPPAPAKIWNFGCCQKGKILQQNSFAQGEWKLIFLKMLFIWCMHSSASKRADGRLSVTCSLLPLLHGTGWLGMKILSGLRPRRCRIPPPGWCREWGCCPLAKRGGEGGGGGMSTLTVGWGKDLFIFCSQVQE